jgi:hypothetical protein
MLLLRWHNFAGPMELQNGRRHFDIVDGPARFAAYRPGKTPLRDLGAAQTDGEDRFGSEPASAAATQGGTPISHDKTGPANNTPPSGRQRPTQTQNPFLDESL